MRWARKPRRAIARVALVGLLGSVLAVPLNGVPAARAAGTLLFNQPFHNNTVDPTYPVTIPALPTGAAGTNGACLTAVGNPSGAGLHSCATNTDAQGLGALRLTNTSTFQEGGVFGATSAPTSEGLDVTFNAYQYGGGSADGMTFVAAAVDPAVPLPPANIGQPGGALGYSSTKQGNLVGLANAYLGVGFDVFGNFSNNVYEGSGCTDPPYISTTGARVPGQVVVRGPGNGIVGYCAINSTATTVTSPVVPLHGTTRAASKVPVEVVINPTGSSFTTVSGVVVAAGAYKVVFTPVGGSPRTLAGTLPTVSSTLYPSTTWLNAAGIPRQLVFGWVGATGSVTDFHEIDNANVVTFNPVPSLNVAQTSYNGSSPQPGDPVTYTVVPSVSSTGSNETSPISVTETMPAGTVPVGAFGTGWVCAAPVGQKITCTNSNAPFAAGSSLSPITVVGIVTGSSVTPALIQSSSTVTASSIDADPGIALTTTAGTIPANPSGITVTPSSSTIAGGVAVTVGGSNLSGATAIEIGTTAEQRAGTPVVLLPCASGPAAGCFTVNANGSLQISSMPSRTSAAAVTVTVVTQGVAGAAAYVYTDKPATPAAPVATAGSSSATVTWVAPASNGSTITGYLVTPYRNGVAQTVQSFDASTTTRTLTGLTVGATYTFTVAAVNSLGTSTASPPSNAVVPYTVPGQPAVPTAVAGDSQATVTWTAPATGGSPITGYVVTPYIGLVAQTPQTFTGTATTQTVTGLTPGTAYTFTVAAQNVAGTGPASARSAAVTPNASPALTFAPPPAGQVAIAYSDQLTFSGGTGPYVWSVSAGTLPPGITLNASTGLLSGTPTTGGSSSFTVRLVDANNQSDTRAATIVIAASPTLTFAPPPAGQVGAPYSDQLTFSGGTGPYVWSVSAGSLPPGITLNTGTGLLSGTPTTTGSSSFTIKIVDANNQSDTRAASLVIGVGPVVITKTADTQAATAGTTVHYTITVHNTGTSAFTGVSFTDPLTDVLDDATYNSDVTASSGTAAFTSPNVTWTGNLAAGATATITYSMTVKPLGSGDGAMSNTVTSTTLGANCAAGVLDSRCAVTITLLGLTITKLSDVLTTTPGTTVHYTITVTNTGQTAYAAANFSDPLAGVLDDATYNADASATSGTVSFASQTLSWTGGLAPGGSASITYSVTVKDPDTGDKNLTNTVTSASAGNNCPSGGTDPRCTTTITALIPKLTIVSSTDVSTVVPTGVVRYTVTVTNTGQTPYTGANFNFWLAGALDNATYNGDATTTSGNLVFNLDGSVTWTGNVPIGGTVTLSASLTVNNPPTGGSTMTSTLTSTTPGSNCPIGGTAPACATTVTILIPALTITKTADTATTTPGQTITYTTVIANTGQTPYTGATINDSLTGVLTDATYNADATTTTGTLTYTAPNLGWTGNLAIGATATITYTATVLNPDPGDKQIFNTITSTELGNNCPTGSTDTACTARVTVLTPALTITKTSSTPTVVGGGTLTYTITVANTGQTPYTGATLTDDLTGILDDATYNADATATTGTATYTAPDLTWTGNLAIGATATITYTMTMHSAGVGSGNGTLTNTVTSATPGNNCPAGGSDPRCTVTVKLSQLLLTQSYSSLTTTPGSVINLNATFTNVGQTPYVGIRVLAGSAGTIDDAIPNGDQVASSGTLLLTATGITWIGNIPVGGVVTVTGSLTVKNPDTGDKIITGTLVSAAPGNNCPAGGTDPLCTARTDVLTPALSITKTADTATQVPGGAVGYTVVIQNTGQTPYTGATVTDDLSGVLTDATYAADAAATAGSVSYSAPVLTWTGDLAVGATVTVTYSVTVLDPDPGNKSLINTAVSSDVGSTCPPNSGNPACVAFVTVLTPALTIVKTSGQPFTTAGGTVAYTITVTNSGQTPYTGAALADDLSGVLDDATYGADASATSGTVGYTAPNLTWTGNLAVGAAATITYTVNVDNPDPGDASLVNTVTSPTTGSNCPSAAPNLLCTATVAVTPTTALTFIKTAGAPSTVRGAVVSYTITIANSAASPYLAATFTDPLTGVLDDATYNANASATSGTVGYSAPNLTWTGDVPAGGSVTVTYSVTVHASPTGDDTLANTLVSSATDGNCPSGGNDPRCKAKVTVSSLTLLNTADTATTTPGGVVRLTSTFTNTGQTPYAQISVTLSSDDLLDDVTPKGDETASSGTLLLGPTGLVWRGDILPGDSVSVTSSFTVNDPDTGDKHIVSTSVSNTPGSNCPTGSSDPRCSATVEVLIPELTIAKTASAPTTVPGGMIGYTLTIHNTGETPYTGISVTDSLTGMLDDAVYNGDGAAATGTVSFSSPVLTWTGDVPLGATVTVTYSVTVRNPDPGGKLMVNSVTSTAQGSTCTSKVTSAACITSVGVLTPLLIIVKSSNVATTTSGATVRYTVTVTNRGQTSYAVAGFSDPLAGVLDDATYNADASTTSGTVSFASQTVSWTGSLGVSSAATITYSVTVKTPDTGDKSLTNTVISATSGNNCPSGGSDPRCTTTVPAAVLTITSSTDVSTVVPTGVVRYTVTVTNTGQTPYTGANFNFWLAGALDNATYNGDATTTSGNLDFNLDGSVTWTGNVPIGGTVTLSASVTVNNPPTGGSTMTSTLTSTTPGNNCPIGGTDPACATTVTILIPALTITKTADMSTATPGSTITYTVLIANTGQSAYTAAVVDDSLAGVLTDATYGNDATATTGSLAYTAPTLTWTGNLAVGATATITYTATVLNPDPGDKQIFNTITSTELGSNCPTIGIDPACTARITVLVPALTITKTSDAPSIVIGGTSSIVAGDVVSYTITVANTGQTAYTGAALTDDLTGVLDDAAYGNDATATSGTVTYTAPNLGWTGDLAIGATATITYSVTTISPDLGDGVLTNTTASATAGSNCPAASLDVRCATSVIVIAQSITLGVLTDGFTLTGVPDTTVRRDGVVTLTVASNAPGGYNVMLRAVSPVLTTPLDTATIPIANLKVRETGTSTFQPLSSITSIPIHSQSEPSALEGDALSNDYEVDIPFVPSGRYSGILEYITSTL
ncbi:fibronectin type III domain-containing protein [Sphaerisporangium corydalis]|uniref:Fibronectin type III domain-containing protein n=1 Tax=Sphaerisporangium corydalis TaxID=1441875 RepID=A0ABV9EIG7_9ACTN